MHFKMIKSSAAYLLTLLTNVSIEANSVDPDQTSTVEQSIFDLHYLTQRLLNISTNQMTFCCDWHSEG